MKVVAISDFGLHGVGSPITDNTEIEQIQASNLIHSVVAVGVNSLPVPSFVFPQDTNNDRYLTTSELGGSYAIMRIIFDVGTLSTDKIRLTFNGQSSADTPIQQSWLDAGYLESPLAGQGSEEVTYVLTAQIVRGGVVGSVGTGTITVSAATVPAPTPVLSYPDDTNQDNKIMSDETIPVFARSGTQFGHTGQVIARTSTTGFSAGDPYLVTSSALVLTNASGSLSAGDISTGYFDSMIEITRGLSLSVTSKITHNGQDGVVSKSLVIDRAELVFPQADSSYHVNSSDVGGVLNARYYLATGATAGMDMSFIGYDRQNTGGDIVTDRSRQLTSDDIALGYIDETFPLTDRQFYIVIVTILLDGPSSTHNSGIEANVSYSP